MKKNNVFYFLVMVIILISCGSTAPFAERDTALKSIDLAKSVEAKKYAPQEYGVAITEYEKGEKLIVTNKKSKQNDEAKQNYEKADKQAREAYEKAAGPYVEWFIKKTDEEIENARSVKTDIVRKKEFDEAVAMNNQARDALNNKNYEQAKSFSLDGLDIIKQAKAEVQKLHDQVNVLDQEYASLLNELKGKKAETAIPNLYQESVKNYEDLQQRFYNGYYEDVLGLYPQGISKARDLFGVIEEKLINAQKSLEKAERLIEESKIKLQKADENE